MSTTPSIAVMEQFVNSVVSKDNSTVCSALAHIGLPTPDSLNRNNSAAGTVVLLEHPVTGLLLLRATDNAQSLSEALQELCGITLSERLRSTVKDDYCVRWMSPDCWLLSCPLSEAFAIENTLREAVDAHVAIVNVSGGYSILELLGSDARNVLKKSTGYDTHPDHLPEGKVINTTFAKAQVTLRCIKLEAGQDRYELVIRRSFCDYLWLWLQRASAEYGLQAASSAD